MQGDKQTKTENVNLKIIHIRNSFCSFVVTRLITKRMHFDVSFSTFYWYQHSPKILIH